MKKATSILLAFVIMLTAITVCADDVPPYDYSSFIGTWYNSDEDMSLRILNIDGNNITFDIPTLFPAEMTYPIINNEVKWSYNFENTEFQDMLIFYDDSVYYASVADGDKFECWFTSDTIKPRKITTDVQKDIVVLVDGNKLTFDQPPVIVNDRVLVPMRAIFEALGADVKWYEEDKTIISSKDCLAIGLVINVQQMYLAYIGYDTAFERVLDVSPMLIGDRTFIPLRAVADAFGASVDWIADSKAVIIKQAELPDKVINIDNYAIDNGSLYISSTISTTLRSLNDTLKSILEEKDIAVKQVCSYPNPEGQGYNVVVNLDYSAKNKFYSLDLQDAVNATILSIDDVYQYALLLDGEKEWYDGHREGSMGDWQKKYDSFENGDFSSTSNQVTAKHILVQDYELAKELLDRIKQGEDFDKLMYEYTEDPGTKNNPNGYTFQRGVMVKEFEDAAFALSINEVSDVVKSIYGYHIIKRVK